MKKKYLKKVNRIMHQLTSGNILALKSPKCPQFVKLLFSSIVFHLYGLISSVMFFIRRGESNDYAVNCLFKVKNILLLTDNQYHFRQLKHYNLFKNQCRILLSFFQYVRSTLCERKCLKNDLFCLCSTHDQEPQSTETWSRI